MIIRSIRMQLLKFDDNFHDNPQDMQKKECLYICGRCFNEIFSLKMHFSKDFFVLKNQLEKPIFDYFHLTACPICAYIFLKTNSCKNTLSIVIPTRVCKLYFLFANINSDTKLPCLLIVASTISTVYSLQNNPMHAQHQYYQYLRSLVAQPMSKICYIVIFAL